MDKILLNPGYHFIATKVLNCLNFQSLCILSQTNKKIMEVCESFMITKGRKNFVFENLNCHCEKVFRNLFQDFITFVNENEIFQWILQISDFILFRLYFDAKITQPLTM